MTAPATTHPLARCIHCQQPVDGPLADCSDAVCRELDRVLADAVQAAGRAPAGSTR